MDSLSGVSSEQRSMIRDVRQLRELFTHSRNGVMHQDSSELSIQIDQKLMQQIFKKAKLADGLCSINCTFYCTHFFFHPY